MPPIVQGQSAALLRTRNVLVAGYPGFVGLGLVSDTQPRIFWTMLLPLLPVGVVLMGFHVWRNICPLAFLGQLGRRLNRGRQRRGAAPVRGRFFPAAVRGPAPLP